MPRRGLRGQGPILTRTTSAALTSGRRDLSTGPSPRRRRGARRAVRRVPAMGKTPDNDLAMKLARVALSEAALYSPQTNTRFLHSVLRHRTSRLDCVGVIASCAGLRGVSLPGSGTSRRRVVREAGSGTLLSFRFRSCPQNYRLQNGSCVCLTPLVTLPREPRPPARYGSF